MDAASRDRTLRVIAKTGLVRCADLEARGVSRTQLYRFVRQGLVERLARGVYVAAGHAPTANHTLAHVAKRVPGGIFCLLTALRFHELTTQAPAEVWIARPKKRASRGSTTRACGWRASRGWRSPKASRVTGGGRRGSRLLGCEDRRRLLQVPQQTGHRRLRSRRCAISAVAIAAMRPSWPAMRASAGFRATQCSSGPSLQDRAKRKLHWLSRKARQGQPLKRTEPLE
jgi:hypothetical protein